MKSRASASTAASRGLSTLLLLAPGGVLFCALVLYPLLANLWLSLHDWDGAGPRTWVGLENYREMLADPVVAVAAVNNLIWLAGYLLAPVLGLALAVLLNQALPGMRLARSLFFMPFVVSQVVVALVFVWFFHTRFGLLTELAGAFGLPAVALLDSERGALFALIFAGLWPQTAYCMILYLTGLATLRPELVEAARMDGAAGWRLFRHAVLPQLRPVHFIVGMVCVVSALRSFDYVVIMTAGGPFNSSTVLAYYMYEQTFVAARYGYGAAIAALLLALMSALVGALLWHLFRGERR